MSDVKTARNRIEYVMRSLTAMKTMIDTQGGMGRKFASEKIEDLIAACEVALDEMPE